MAAKLLTSAVLGAAALGLAVTLAAKSAALTGRDGVFSAAHAERGARVFESICTNCHELAEFTAPGAYLDEVEGKPLWETFEYVSAEMPEDDPASLRPEE